MASPSASRLICPPCRQDLLSDPKFAALDLYVEFKGQRQHVCCSGCIDKQIRYWGEYLDIMQRKYNQTPLQTQDNLDAVTPVGVNPSGKGVCSACMTGLCMLREHLPPSALAELSGLGRLGAWAASFVHSPDDSCKAVP
jgi:hypothetical protein